MKRTLSFFLIGLALSSAADEAADRAALAEAAGLMKSNVAVRVKWRGPIPDNLYGHAEIDRAADLFRRVYSSAEALPALRVEAAKGLADAILEASGDTNVARQVVADARAFKGLSDADRGNLEEALGILLYRFYDFKAALPILEKCLGTNIASRATQCFNRPYRQKMDRILECRFRLDGLERTIAAVESGDLSERVHPEQAVSWCAKHERREDAVRIAKRAFDDPAFEASRPRLLEQIGGMRMCDGFEAFVADYPERARKVTTKNPKAWRWQVDALTGRFSFRYGLSWNNLYYKGENAVVGRDTRWGDWLYDFVSQPPAGADSVKPEELFKTALFARNRSAQAASAAEAVLAASNATAQAVADARLYLAVWQAKDAAAAVRNVQNAVAALKPATKKDEAAHLLTAARFAMQLRREETARAVYAMRETMLTDLPPRAAECPFVKDAPDNIADILASDIWKKRRHELLDRRYGDNIEFLLATDMANVGRRVTSGADGDFAFTEFVTFCDAQGVKILLYAHLDDIEAVKRGFRKPGNYEMYVASSFEAPYATFIVDMPPTPPSDSFVTQYSNETGFRRVTFADGTAAITHRTMSDGIATLVSLAWSAYWKDLPSDGAKWQFEAIHWERGGWTWGGSKTCHARSSFGSLVFSNLTEENLRAVRLNVILAAKENYERALDPNRNGCLDFWRDPGLGDRGFYFARVRPLEDRLTPYLAKVTPGMSGEDIDDVWAKAAHEWINIDYVVSRERTDWLQEKMIGGEK